MFSNWMLNPWSLNQQFIHGWLNMQQSWLSNSWEIAMWQQVTVQKMWMENMKWFMHCLELSHDPQVLSRYLRMNWLKPYEAFAGHAISANRLISHMWIQNWNAWQDGGRTTHSQ